MEKDLFDWRAKTIFIHHASLSHTATSDFKPSHPPTSSPKPQLSSAINHHLATGCWALSKVTLHPATPPPEVGSRGEGEKEEKKGGKEKKGEGHRLRTGVQDKEQDGERESEYLARLSQWERNL